MNVHAAQQMAAKAFAPQRLRQHPAASPPRPRPADRKSAPAATLAHEAPDPVHIHSITYAGEKNKRPVVAHRPFAPLSSITSQRRPMHERVTCSGDVASRSQGAVAEKLMEDTAAPPPQPVANSARLPPCIAREREEHTRLASTAPCQATSAPALGTPCRAAEALLSERTGRRRTGRPDPCARTGRPAAGGCLDAWRCG